MSAVKVMLKNLGLVVIIATTLSMGQAPGHWATIAGRVLSFDGKPVAGARVTLFPMDVAMSGIMPKESVTDLEGRYRLSTPAFPGRIRLGAVKESAGYPDTQGLLFVSKEDNLPIISLAPGDHLTGVDIRLGPPDGILEGTVIDAQTRSPIVRARITLHRREPDAIYSSSLQSDGHFAFALPDTPIQIRVIAPGYRPWTYVDLANGEGYLLLKGSSDHRVLMVELIKLGK